MNILTSSFAATLSTVLIAAHADAQAKPATGESGTQQVPALLVLKEVVKATALSGCDVRWTGDAKVGKVKDLVVEPATGVVDLAIVAFDKLGDLGDKTVAIPFQLLSTELDAKGKLQYVRFSGTVDQVRAAAPFDGKRWSKLTDNELRTWCTGVHVQFDGMEHHDGESAPKKTLDEAAKQADSPAASKQTPKGAVRLMKASALMDIAVMGGNQENLGKIEELAIDANNGRVIFFLVDLGGFLGIGEKSYALPWSFATFRSNEKGEVGITTPVSKEILEKAPEYDSGDWKAMVNPAWISRLYAHFHVQPYWTTKPIEIGYRKDTKGPDGGR
jgi:sporulation protein YlmC with PRC-barrel domain